MCPRSRIVAAFLLLVTLAPLATGCFRRQFPERRLYVLNVERAEAARPRSPAVIRIGRVRAEPQYERKGFVYRTGELTYADDFYNAFYVSPAQLVRASMHEWMQSSGLFASVVDVDSLIGAGWVLESRLLDFYIDKRPGEGEQAVVRLAVTLVDASQASPRSTFTRTYDAAVAVTGGGGKAYVTAWSDALSELYVRLEADLAAAISARRTR